MNNKIKPARSIDNELATNILVQFKIEAFIKSLTNDICAFRMAKKDLQNNNVNAAIARVNSDADKLSPEQRAIFASLMNSI